MSNNLPNLGELGYVESVGATTSSDDAGNVGGRRFYGKYRGTVINNVDLEGRGRLLVQVPDVLGLFTSTWAMPCVPVAGIQSGIYVVPPINAGVWVEFEQGNHEKPIWVGCWWGSALEPPLAATLVAKITPPTSPVIVLETSTKNQIAISDVPIPPMVGPGITLKSGTSTLIIDSKGVTITAPTVTINGVTTVNNGALIVTL